MKNCKWSNNLPTIEVLKANLKNRKKMERSNSIFNDKSYNGFTNSMISNGYSLTFVINTIFAIFNSKEISKISSIHVFT
jgi:hypothetical protein